MSRHPRSWLPPRFGFSSFHQRAGQKVPEELWVHFRVGERAAAAAVRPSCGRVRTEAGSSRSVREARGSWVRAVAAPARCPCRVRPRGPPKVAVRFCLRPSGRARPTSRWPWVGTEDGRAAEASSRAPGTSGCGREAPGRGGGHHLHVVRGPGLVQEKGVTPSYLVFCLDGSRPGQHHLHLSKLWLVSWISYSFV